MIPIQHVKLCTIYSTLKQKNFDFRASAEQAVAQAVQRNGPTARRSGPAARRSGPAAQREGIDIVLDALKSSKDDKARSSLLRVLGMTGDRRAYDVIIKASKDKNADIQETAIRVLALWPNPIAANQLLEIIKTTDNKLYRVLAIRGFIRLLKQSSEKPGMIAKQYREITPLVKQPDEIQLILSGLAALPHGQSLKLCMEYINNRQVREEACIAMVKIAEAIKNKPQSREIVKNAMGKVLADCTDNKLKKRAGTVIKNMKMSDNKKNPYPRGVQKTGPYHPNPREDAAFFNRKDLKGWKDFRDPKIWKITEQGVITGRSEEEIDVNRFLWSSVEVKNFYLSVDMKLLPVTGNGGIHFRSIRIDEHGQATGYQADAGKTGKGESVWGKLYHEKGRGKLAWTNHAEKEVRHGGWNRCEILAVGSCIWMAINGKLAIACNEPKGERSGFIAFQLHRGPPMTVHYKINKFIHDPEVSLAGMNEKQLRKELVIIDKSIVIKKKKKKKQNKKK